MEGRIFFENFHQNVPDMDLAGSLIVLFGETGRKKQIDFEIVAKDHKLIHGDDGNVFLH